MLLFIVALLLLPTASVCCVVVAIGTCDFVFIAHSKLFCYLVAILSQKRLRWLKIKRI